MLNGIIWLGAPDGIRRYAPVGSFEPLNNGLDGDSQDVWDIVTDGVMLYIATSNGVFQSGNNGQNWQLIGLTDNADGDGVRSLEVDADTLYAGARKPGIHTAIYQPPIIGKSLIVAPKTKCAICFMHQRSASVS